MMGTTHQHVGMAAAVGVSAVAHLPLSAAMVVCATAARGARTPDSSERRFRVEHRTVTHWLLTCAAMAVIPVIVLVALVILVGAVIQYGWEPARFDDVIAHVPVVIDQVDATARGHAWHGDVSEFVTGAAVIVGTLAAIGRLCGMLMHTLADACTPHGSPLFGPFDRPRVVDEETGEVMRGEVRCRHLLPYWARVKTDSVDDSMVGIAALGVTLLVVYVSLRGFHLPEVKRG